MRLDRRARWTLWLALGALHACAPTYADGYEAAFSRGMRAKNAGRYVEAISAFDEAAKLGDRYKDRDEARLHTAEAYEKLERYPEAERTYTQIIFESQGRYQGIRAEFQRARLVLEHLDPTQGEAMLFEVATKHPSSGLSRHAMKRLLEVVVTRDGDDAGLALLQRYRVRGTDLEESVQYERGLILMRQGKYEEARGVFVASARAHPYPHGALTDDALFQASICDERLGKPERAIEVLREMLSVREAAYTGSSYERPRFPDAQLRIARLYRDAMKDPLRARKELSVFASEHVDSRFLDDALWERALLEREANDTRAVCASMKELEAARPESRYTKCMQVVCPTAAADARPCPSYVMRSLGLANEPETEAGARSD